MSGSRSKRGLSDFLSQELKGPPAQKQDVEVRESVTDRVGERHAAVSPPVHAPVVPAAPAFTASEEVRTPEVSKVRTDRVRVVEEPPEEPEPLYLRLTRKEVRFRDEQLGALHAVARRLSKARRGAKGERITENTLVRVAVDLLLMHGDELSGHDEVTLLESLRKLGRKKV